VYFFEISGRDNRYCYIIEILYNIDSIKGERR
jgi:hypothetical protein